MYEKQLIMSTHQLPILNEHNTFESAICDLFNLLERTNTFKKFGKNGHSQKGIDIFSTEKDIAIQCKKKDLSRRDVTLRKELLIDIENDVNNILNKKLKIKITRLYIVSTYKDHPDLDEYCDELKEKLNTNFEIIYWGWDTLENRIINERRLLEKYWISFIITENTVESELKKNMNLKRKIKEDFGEWLNYSFKNRKKRSRMLIRAFDGKQYPNSNEPNELGEYSWFAEEIKSLYHNGVEFITSIEMIEVYEDNSWGFINEGGDKKIIKTVKVAKVGQINFSDIVDYDIEGDEYYNYPHIFCKFRHNGLPFENFYYYNMEKTYEYFELKDRNQKQNL
jgi:hypothetical protein